MSNTLKIYTIGHSTRSLEEFINILKHFQIGLVIDVRRFPSSKKFPWFGKENLEKELLNNKIQYIHFPELGGFRKEGYKNFAETGEFSQAIEKLLEIIDDKTTAIMCAEWNVMKCHRWFISETLSKMNHRIFHIINKNSVKNHLELPRKITKVPCDKF